MEIRINDQHVATLLALVEKEYEDILGLRGTFTAEERQLQVEALEELTAIKESLEATQVDNGGGADMGWVQVN